MRWVLIFRIYNGSKLLSFTKYDNINFTFSHFTFLHLHHSLFLAKKTQNISIEPLNFYTGHLYHPKENPRDIITKTTYSTSIIAPILFVIFQLKVRIARKTKINIIKSIEIEHAAPLLDTPRYVPFTAVHSIHGRGNTIFLISRRILFVYLRHCCSSSLMIFYCDTNLCW